MAALSLSALACGKPAFTQAARQRYGFTPAELRRMQFYTSSEIVLRRELPTQQRSEVNGEVVVSDGLLIQEVVIPAKTPGVALRVEDDFLLIGFSPDNPAQALWFAWRKPGDEVTPLDERRYRLVPLANSASEVGDFAPEYAKGFLFLYDGAWYHLTDAAMRDVHLLYDEGTFTKARAREKPPGWRLNGGAPSE